MLSNYFYLILMLSLTTVGYSQDCSCSKSFSTLRRKIENNYAGYFDKVNRKTKHTYDAMLYKLQKRADSLQVGKECRALLSDYIEFFKDGHLQLENRYLPENVAVQLRELPSDDMHIYFNQLPLADDDIRGIWKTESYELAIINSQISGDYDAVVLTSENESWKKGMVKMHLRKINPKYYQIEYRLGNFEIFHTKGILTKNVLEILSIGTFEKVTPKPPEVIDIKNYQSLFPDSDITFLFPNDSTAILFLGSFGNQYEAMVDSLMITHKKDLEQRPYWIIDISYNGGGGTGTYKSLIPYLFTNNIKRSGSYYRLSKDNIEMMEAFLQANPTLPAGVNSFFSNLITTGKKKAGSWYFEPGKIFTYSNVQPNPRHVGVLVSTKTASSGEIFVMDAKQSKKVTIFGTRTQGMVDYGDGFKHTIGCDSLTVSIPTRKSEYLKHFGYEKIGLSPDVKLPEDHFEPYLFIMRYYRQKRKLR